jgi:hypothetical protein
MTSIEQIEGRTREPRGAIRDGFALFAHTCR